MRIIGMAGQAGVGKDTAADYLVEKLNTAQVKVVPANSRMAEPIPESWTRIGFANAVKKIFMDAFGVDRNFVEEWKRKDESPPGFNQNVRKSLQFIGDGFRQIRSNIWIETAFRGDKKIILNDVRYINEAKAIRERSGVTVVLWRPNFENNDPNPSESQIKPIVDWCTRCEEGVLPKHDSFLVDYSPDGIEFFDFFIKNDSTKESLYAKIDKILIPYLKEMEK
jgi:hypothetical protein